MAASQASEPSFDTSSPSTSLTFSYARFTSCIALASAGSSSTSGFVSSSSVWGGPPGLGGDAWPTVGGWRTRTMTARSCSCWRRNLKFVINIVEFWDSKFKWKTILDLYLIWEKLIYSCTQHEKWGLLNVRKEKRSHNLSVGSLFLLSHLVKPGLKSFVSWIHSPHHLQALFSLLFHNVSQQGLKLFIFIIPCCEHFKASYHNLQEIIKTTII